MLRLIKFGSEDQPVLCVFDFTGTQAPCADVHSLCAAVDLNRNTLDIGVPDPVGPYM